QHVHVVVLDALARGEGVVAHRRAGARDLAGRHRRADAAAAEDDAAVAASGHDRLGDLAREDGIVGRLRREGAEVLDRMAQLSGEMDALLLEGEAGVIAAPGQLPLSSPFARSTTWSTVKPSFFITTSPGAEAPKRSRPIEPPRSPTYFCQPSVTPASIESRAPAACGRTSSRYACGCLSKNGQHGIETTRVGMPSASSLSRPPAASWSSEPVPMRISRGFPPLASARMYAPRETSPFAPERSRTGRFWRQSTRPTGPSR